MSESSLERLLEKLDEIWNDVRVDDQKGSAFERLIASYLRTAPEYAGRFEEVYLWQDWPERGRRHDHGIDIVAKDLHTGGGARSSASSTTRSTTSPRPTSTRSSRPRARSTSPSRIIVSTAKDWGANAKSRARRPTVPPVRGSGRTTCWSPRSTGPRSTGARRRTSCRRRGSTSPAAPERGDGRRPRRLRDRRPRPADHGLRHRQDLHGLKIAEELATSRKAEPTTVLFLVPSIQLLNQTLREWKQETEIPFRAVRRVLRHQGRAQPGPRTSTVRRPHRPGDDGHRGAGRAVRAARRATTSSPSSSPPTSRSTSSRQAQKAGVPEFDLVVCDEAHRTTGVTLAGRGRVPVRAGSTTTPTCGRPSGST